MVSEEHKRAVEISSESYLRLIGYFPLSNFGGVKEIVSYPKSYGTRAK